MKKLLKLLQVSYCYFNSYYNSMNVAYVLHKYQSAKPSEVICVFNNKCTASRKGSGIEN